VNILRGEMSLIGPRPERPEIVAQLERVLPNYRRRLWVRPGVTGLAQVLQAPDTDVESVRRKLNFDLFYVDHASAFLDIRIMIGTALHLLAVPGERVAALLRFPDDRLHRREADVASDLRPIGEFAG
jgi:lipopolysaccharide/colanic/teichoic acid biosynthesis glycosyltransferase